MRRQSKQKDREHHKVKINSGLTAKKLKNTEDLNFFEVFHVTLRFFSLLLSGGFGFANLLIFRIWGKIIGLALLDNKPTVSVLVSNFYQLLTLFDDQLCFCNQLVNVSRTTSRDNLIGACRVSRVAGKLSRVAGKLSRVQKIVAGPKTWTSIVS